MGKTRTILGGKRFYIAVLLFFNLLINYIDRVNLSVAAPVLAKQFHWDAARMGWVFSAYLWTYTILLIPTGALLDRIGARRVAAFGIGRSDAHRRGLRLREHVSSSSVPRGGRGNYVPRSREGYPAVVSS
jgi:hypothetical protein